MWAELCRLSDEDWQDARTPFFHNYILWNYYSLFTPLIIAIWTCLHPAKWVEVIRLFFSRLTCFVYITPLMPCIVAVLGVSHHPMPSSCCWLFDRHVHCEILTKNLGQLPELCHRSLGHNCNNWTRLRITSLLISNYDQRILLQEQQNWANNWQC